ncbi:GAF domain-containing protein [Thermopolyspora sp. NPDC052614]|uniref:helix-turn-helix domain-containing protein n=1 Tax=Thermopolyspora sp. NPDC052614 TaxID=3155682 RepID=UPI003430C472
MLALHEIDGLEVDEGLQSVVARIARRMGTDVATLYAYDRDRERLVLAATHGLARSAIGFVTLALGEGISGEAALRRSPVSAADVTDEPQFKIIPGFDQSRYRSILAVPVCHRGELLGVLNVQTAGPRGYGPADRDLLRGLADEVARYLARYRSDGRLSLRLRGPTLLSTLSGMVAASGGRTEVCVRVLAELAVALPEAEAAIALYADGAEPVLVAPDGGGEVHPRLAAALRGGTVLDQTGSGQAGSDQAVFVLPLGRDGDTCGALALLSADGASTWRDPAVRHYLGSVAEQLGLALERLPQTPSGSNAEHAEHAERGAAEPGLYDRLVSFVLNDRGLEALVAEASAVCGTPIGVVDGFGAPLAGTVTGEVSADLPLHPVEAPPGRLLVGPSPPPEDDLAVVAHVIALELAKWKAAFEVESRLRGDVLDLLLADDDVDPREALPRASLVGLNLARPYRPVWFVYDGAGEDGTLAARSRAQTVRRALGEPPQVVIFLRPHGILALVDEEAGDVEARARAAARSLGALTRSDAVGVGCGAPVVWPNGFRAAVRRAALAADLGRRLGHRAPVDVSRLGVYGLLLELDETAWRAFVTEQLGPLLDHDAVSGGELVRTLEAYHCLQGGLRAVADALFVHVNTLKYRLARIDALTGGRFSSPSLRFQMFLALYALRLLEPGRPSFLADDAAAGLLSSGDSADGRGPR